jgi:hypothetical protein
MVARALAQDEERRAPGLEWGSAPPCADPRNTPRHGQAAVFGSARRCVIASRHRRYRRQTIRHVAMVASADGAFMTQRGPPKKSIGAEMRHLADAERIVARGEQCIARQRALIQRLQGRGDDTTAEERLLAILVGSQAVHERHCIRLRVELVGAVHDEIASSEKD